MADVRNWASFIRGRWDWTRFGYEAGFPRGCQFTDVDAVVEFDGRALMIEGKQWDGEGDRPDKPSTGQMLYLKYEVEAGKTVLVLFGCGCCNNPWAVYDVGRDEWFDWRGLELADRRTRLKHHIDRAMEIAK